MTADWVVTFTFDADPSMETMDAWETQLEGFDALVSRVPGHGIDVTVYAPGDWVCSTRSPRWLARLCR